MRPLTALAALVALAAVVCADSLGEMVASRLRTRFVVDWCMTSADRNNYGCYFTSTVVHCNAAYPLCKGWWETRTNSATYVVGCTPASAVANPDSIGPCSE